MIAASMLSIKKLLTLILQLIYFVLIKSGSKITPPRNNLAPWPLLFHTLLTTLWNNSNVETG